MKIHRLGVIGVGSIAGKFHLPAFSGLPNASLCALSDLDSAKLKGVGARYGIKKLFTNYRQMLRDRDIDAVVIASPSGSHYRHVMDALKAGKHVMVEKPFALTGREAWAMTDYAKKVRRVLLCAQHNRFRPETQAILKTIRSGAIGEVYYSKATVLVSRGVPIPAHYTKSAKSGGGPLYDSGAHLIDIAWWLMGCPKPVQVTGNCWHKLSHERHLQCEDLAVAYIRFTNKAVMVLEASYLIHEKDDRIECRCYGDKGSVVWPKAILTKEQAGRLRQQKLSYDPNIFASVAQAKHFLSCIDKPKAPRIVPADQSATVVRMLEAIHESSKTGKTIYLNERDR